MDFLPFEIYSAPFPKDKYGIILEIPEYCTQSELEAIEEHCSSNTHYNSPIPSDVYPNTAIFDIPIPYKTQCIYDSRLELFDWFRDNHQDAKYRFDMDKIPTRESRMYLGDRVQGSPKGMGKYPPHSDAGKMITCIFPLRPVSSNSTMFTGLDNEQSEVFVPWKINHAYLFCSSQYTYHWYEGDQYNDRWIYNFNIFDKDRMSNSVIPEYNEETGYPNGLNTS